MQNKTYSDLSALVKALAGVDNFTTAEDTKILAMANRRLYQGYAASLVWPRYISVGARPANDGLIAREYSGSVLSTTTETRSGTTVTLVCSTAVDFAVGMEVTVSGLGYSTEDPNGTFTVTAISTTTIDNDTFTYELDDGTGTETYTGTGTVTPVAVPDIADFFRVWSGNPNASNNGYDVEWYEDVDGVHVTGDHSGLGGYYVSFKREWPGPYLSSATDIPLELFYYAAHATYADFLRMDGQIDKALAEEQAAQSYLALEMEKAAHAKNANRLYSRITTYTSTQSR